jgi:hypothetical protein
MAVGRWQVGMGFDAWSSDSDGCQPKLIRPTPSPLPRLVRPRVGFTTRCRPTFLVSTPQQPLHHQWSTDFDEQHIKSIRQSARTNPCCVRNSDSDGDGSTPGRREHNSPRKNRFFALLDHHKSLGISKGDYARKENVPDRTARF